MRVPIRHDRPGRIIDLVSIGVTLVILAALVRELIVLLPNLEPAKVAVDYNLYMEATRRWFGGGSYYLAEQLTGPYEALPGVILYPPVFALVMLPFLFMPWPVYWALPIAAVVFAMNRHRPRPIVWPGIALCLWFPGTIVILVAGNPVMLMIGALALGTIWAWPSVFVLLKPSLGFFALFGIWRRSWWIALGMLVFVSLPFGAAWLDYATVLLDARHPLGLLYNLGQVPTMMLPLIVWAGRRSGSRSPTEVP
jgi:hypothetical protein